jgi:hypothetical protein
MDPRRNVAVSEVPPWLAAWRAQQAAQPPAQREAHPRHGGNGGKRRASVVAAANRPKRNWHGFIEPKPWPYDGGTRREPVLDDDYCPPRVVRKVGWRSCMACAKPFFSEDVIALRLCDGPDGCRDAPTKIDRIIIKAAAPAGDGRQV